PRLATPRSREVVATTQRFSPRLMFLLEPHPLNHHRSALRARAASPRRTSPYSLRSPAKLQYLPSHGRRLGTQLSLEPPPIARTHAALPLRIVAGLTDASIFGRQASLPPHPTQLP